MSERSAEWTQAHRRAQARWDGLPTIVILAGVVVVLLMVLGSRDQFGNDGAQYFSVTDNLMAGRGITTSTIYYESQAKLGLPAAQTIWPPGLPLLAAGAAKVLGLQPDAGLRLVNAIAHAASGVLLYWIVWTLRGSRPLAIGIAAGFLLYVPLLRYVMAGISEPTYHLAIIASAACVLKALDADDAKDVRWIGGAAACVAAGVLVRYPGAFQLMPLGLAGWYIFARRRSIGRALQLILAICLPVALLFAALLIRNNILTGSFTGAASGPRAPTMAELAFDAKWGALGLFGVSHFALIKVAALAFGVALVLGALALVRNRAAFDWTLTREQAGFALYGIASAFVSTGLLIFLASRSIFYSFESRYFVVAALMILLSAVALAPRSRITTRRAMLAPSPAFAGTALAVCAAMLVLTQHIDLFLYRDDLSAQTTMRRALQAGFHEATVESYLRQEASLKTPVFSNQSQLLHLILARPTIGVPEYRLTPHVWSAEDILALARKAGAHYLVVFRRMPLGKPDGSTDYVWRFASSGHPALTTLSTTDDLILFRIADGV